MYYTVASLLFSRDWIGRLYIFFSFPIKENSSLYSLLFSYTCYCIKFLLVSMTQSTFFFFFFAFPSQKLLVRLLLLQVLLQTICHIFVNHSNVQGFWHIPHCYLGENVSVFIPLVCYFVAGRQERFSFKSINVFDWESSFGNRSWGFSSCTSSTRACRINRLHLNQDHLTSWAASSFMFKWHDYIESLILFNPFRWSFERHLEYMIRGALDQFMWQESECETHWK